MSFQSLSSLWGLDNGIDHYAEGFASFRIYYYTGPLGKSSHYFSGRSKGIHIGIWSVLDQRTIDQYFCLHDLQNRGVYLSYTNPLTDYYHLITTMFHVYLCPSGSDFWHSSFWRLVAYFFSLWIQIFFLCRHFYLLHIK